MKGLYYNDNLLFMFEAVVTNEQILKWIQDNITILDEKEIFNDPPQYLEAYLNTAEDYIIVSGDETYREFEIKQTDVIKIGG